MKSWILAFALAGAAAWFVITPFRSSAMPGMIRGGTEQILAQWRDAMLAYKADEGAFPPADPDLSALESYELHLFGENRLKKEYLNRNSVRLRIFLPVDGWGNPLLFDPTKTGDLSHVVSAGEDGLPGTADDIDSQNVTQRNIPVPTDKVDEKAARRKAAKTAAGAAANPAATVPSTPEPAPETPANP